jgi:hypothetical protein
VCPFPWFVSLLTFVSRLFTYVHRLATTGTVLQAMQTEKLQLDLLNILDCACGTIVDINKPDDARDACIAMVDFPVYCGPAVVPLTEIRAPNCKGMSLTLAWAITIRKAQGMTLNRITVDLGRKEFASGVALSPCKNTPRVKTTSVRPRPL